MVSSVLEQRSSVFLEAIALGIEALAVVGLLLLVYSGKAPASEALPWMGVVLGFTRRDKLPSRAEKTPPASPVAS